MNFIHLPEFNFLSFLYWMLTPGFLGYIRSKIQTGELACAMRYTTTNGLPTLSFPRSKCLFWLMKRGKRLKGKQHPLSTDVTCGYKPIQIAETSTVAPVKCLTTNIPLPPHNTSRLVQQTIDNCLTSGCDVILGSSTHISSLTYQIQQSVSTNTPWATR